MSDNKCKWKSEYDPNYECREDPLVNGHCILHSRDEKKDLEAFKQKVEERMRVLDKICDAVDKIVLEAWINLKGCYFPKGFPADYFSRRTFENAVDFSEATFPEINFLEATFLEKANFSRVIFSEDAYFSWAKFLQNANFCETTFLQADFYTTTFLQASFNGTTFSQEANFSKATFSQMAYFPRAKFKEAYFRKTKFSQTNFSGAIFLQVVNFNEAEFSQEADFGDTTFEQGADFLKAKFLKEVKFDKTISRGQKTNFREARFEGAVNFLGPRFESEETSFSDAEFIGQEEEAEETDYKKAVEVPFQRSQEVKFDNPHFHNQVYFIKTEFKKSCKFWWSEFPKTDKQAVFEETDLSKCSFLHSNIDKVDFRYCKFGEEKGRKNVLKDERDCDEKVKKSDKGPLPYNGRVLIDTKEEEEARKGYEPVHRLYLELKKNFEEKKDWNTAGDFHFGEMESRRKMKNGWLRRNILSLEALYYWASGYGERPWRAGFWMTLLILVCALFYMPSMDKVSPSQVLEGGGQTAAQESAGNTMQGHPATPGLPAEGCSGRACSTLERYLEGLNTSLRVTARLDTKETGWPRTIQSILGPILIALFFLALRRKVKR